MARLPSAPAPRTLAIAGWIITAKDIMLASADGKEEAGGTISLGRLPGGMSLAEFQRRADEAASVIHRAIVAAAGQAMAADARVTPAHQADLARNVAAKAKALIRAIHGDAAPTPGDVPTPLALMLEHVTAAAPPHSAHASAVERMMHGSTWWAQVVHARTEQDLPPGDAPTSMTADEAADFAARLAPPTPEQEQRGRSEAAVFTAMKMLPDALGMLIALAGAAEKAAAGAAARDRREEHKRGGRRTGPFASIAMRGIVRAYYLVFGAWPEGKPDLLPVGRPEGRTWTRAVLEAACANLTTGAVRGDSALVAERVGSITALRDVTLGDYINDAVSAEAEA